MVVRKARSTARVLGLLVALAVPTHATAAPSAPQHELVGPRTCLAGAWGTRFSDGWRVQLGVFEREPNAARRLVALAAAGVTDVELFVAVWAARGDAEPLVVVSPPFESRAQARAWARERGLDRGLVRRYRTWTW